MIPVKYINAKRVLDWYMEQCTEACTTEAQNALQYINLQLVAHRANSVLNTLQSYPITLTPVTN